MCPQCNTVSLDDEKNCGVCGAYIGKVGPELAHDALYHAEKAGQQLEAAAAEYDHVKLRENLLAKGTIRLLTGPVFAILGTLGVFEYGIQTGLFSFYAVMLLIGFAGIIHDLQGKDDPPYGWIKPYWILVKMWFRSKYPREMVPKSDPVKYDD